jgi:hypothetical protein
VCVPLLATSALAAIGMSAVAPDATARPRDRDRDGLADRWERRYGLSTRVRNGRRDPDRDRLTNLGEQRYRTHPRSRDIDRDSLGDAYEVRVTRTNPWSRDTDRDGLGDAYEVRVTRTDPRRRDTDRDGLGDGYEVRVARTDPRRSDTDRDGRSDGEELRAGTDPRNPPGTPSPNPTPSPAPTPTPDTTGPQVAVTAPSAGATVSGTVPWRASAFDPSGVTKVEFWVGDALKQTDTTAPYEGAWDTTVELFGAQSIRVRAFDGLGNSATVTATVTVANPLDLLGEFVQIGVHPDAVRQSTAWGKTLSALAGWNGKLYAGYGDYNVNTGPIAVRPYDPRTDTFAASVSLNANTEAIHNWREIGGRLYGLYADQRTDTAAYAAMGTVVDGREVWTTERAPGVFLGQHIMDLASLDGRDLWLATCGVELLRRPEGASWQTVDYGDVGCLQWLGVLGGKLYVQLRGKTTRVFDGTAWANGPDLLPRNEPQYYEGWRPVTFAGRIVQRGRYPFTGTPTKLSIFDGRTFRLSPWYVHDHIVGDDGYLYALTVPSQDVADREKITVRRTKDLVDWTLVAAAPAGSRSLETLGGKLYVGATNARLFVLGG